MNCIEIVITAFSKNPDYTPVLKPSWNIGLNVTSEQKRYSRIPDYY